MTFDVAHIVLGVSTILGAIGNIVLWRKVTSESRKIDVEATSVEVKNVQEAIAEWRILYDNIKRENIEQNARQEMVISQLQSEVKQMDNALSAIHRLADILLKEISTHNPKRSNELRSEYKKIIKDLKVA
jgi:hypothetical protein